MPTGGAGAYRNSGARGGKDTLPTPARGGRTEDAWRGRPAFAPRSSPATGAVLCEAPGDAGGEQPILLVRSAAGGEGGLSAGGLGDFPTTPTSSAWDARADAGGLSSLVLGSPSDPSRLATAPSARARGCTTSNAPGTPASPESGTKFTTSLSPGESGRASFILYRSASGMRSKGTCTLRESRAPARPPPDPFAARRRRLP